MKSQTVEFAVVRKNGIVTQIGRTGINQPKPNFKGGCIKWYPDKPKEKKE